MVKPTFLYAIRSLDDHTEVLTYLILNQKKEDLELPDFLECHFESKILSQHVY